MSDQVTPVLGYRRLVSEDDRTAPSFLLESVEAGTSVGRYSFLGTSPSVEVIARATNVSIRDHRAGTSSDIVHEDPLEVVRSLSEGLVIDPDQLAENGIVPRTFAGGWVGYAGFDTIRYLEPGCLPFDSAPDDDRNLPDLHMGLYLRIVVFDHVSKTMHCVCMEPLKAHASSEAASEVACDHLDGLVRSLATHSVPLKAGEISLETSVFPSEPGCPTTSREKFIEDVGTVQEYIRNGDAFQVVLSQRFRRSTQVDPFDIYRALRIVNPSPYQIYLQAADSILISASPEILCRVRDRVVTNRPLAGTRRRGATGAEDERMEQELLSDQKERAEHVMLVDLGRNDLGKVSEDASIEIPVCMEVERYSHVMHISSTVTGILRDRLDAWDALRATLPVGTVSGAPKIRSIQIIDELEPVRRGPYAGGIGLVGLDGNMDIALALRTMVVPISLHDPEQGTWQVDLQAGAGIVLDSDPASEHQECLNKAAALSRAIDLAESSLPR